MTVLSLPRHLAMSALVLTVCWSLDPSIAAAGKPDFTIRTHEDVDTWTGDSYGSWAMTGVEKDAGPLGGGHGWPLSRLWLEGDLGSMYVQTDGSEPGHLTFEVLDGTGSYESWIGASGTFSISYGPSKRNGHRAVRRVLEGFQP